MINPKRLLAIIACLMVFFAANGRANRTYIQLDSEGRGSGSTKIKFTKVGIPQGQHAFYTQGLKSAPEGVDASFIARLRGYLEDAKGPWPWGAVTQNCSINTRINYKFGVKENGIISISNCRVVAEYVHYFSSQTELTYEIKATNSNPRAVSLEINQKFYLVGEVIYEIKGTVNLPALASCTITAPGIIVLPDTGLSELERLAPGQTVEQSRSLPFSVNCSGSSSYKMTLAIDKTDGACIASTLPGYNICIDGTNLAGGSAVHNHATPGKQQIILRAGRGRDKPRSGEGVGVLRITVAPE